MWAEILQAEDGLQDDTRGSTRFEASPPRRALQEVISGGRGASLGDSRSEGSIYDRPATHNPRPFARSARACPLFHFGFLASWLLGILASHEASPPFPHPPPPLPHSQPLASAPSEATFCIPVICTFLQKPLDFRQKMLYICTMPHLYMLMANCRLHLQYC